jgi:predicted peptidase
MPLFRKILAALSLALLCLLAACMSAPQRSVGEFVERSVDVDGSTYRYQVFVPSSAAGGKRPPVILFLHGSGERGSDNHKQVEVGIGSYARAHLSDFPAIVVFPQAPENMEWNQVTDMAFAQLDAATREFNGDPDRTYLTGLSMGGYGTWDYALRSPKRFAALVPICGGLTHPERPSMNVDGIAGEADPYATVAGKLRDIPVWIFHGAKDDVVPPEFSRRMDAALKAAGAKDARYTEFPDASHNSWDPAYQHTPDLWPWLFAQRK